MEIAGTVLVTPFENPAQYQPDWRHNAALLIHRHGSTRMPAEIRCDPFVKRQVRYLQRKMNQCAYRVEKSAEQKAFDIYNSTYGNNVAHYLEPLLLTDQPYTVIAGDLSHTPDTIEYYEKLYWACRTKSGAISPSEMVKTSFALGTEHRVKRGDPLNIIWKALGASLGYTALVSTWNWQNPAGYLDPEDAMYQAVSRMGLGQMNVLAITGQLQAIDITAFLAQSISYTKMRHDTKGNSEVNEGYELALKLLNMMAPQMNARAVTGEALAAYETGNVNAIEAEGRITATGVEDKGAMGSRATIDQKLQEAMSPLAKQYEESHND